MKKMRRIILPVAVLSVLGGLVLTSRTIPVQAFGDQPNLIIQRLVAKFGLKQEEVQGVFNEARQERQQENQARFEQNLAQAVSDGKLSVTQKQLLLDKHKELLAKRNADIETWQNLSVEERRNQAQQGRDELTKWANDNGIDPSLLGFLGEGRGGLGRGMMGQDLDN